MPSSATGWLAVALSPKLTLSEAMPFASRAIGSRTAA